MQGVASYASIAMAALGDCVIFLESLSTDQCRTLSCSHVLHERCVMELLRHGLPDTFPVCRQSCPDLLSAHGQYEKAAMCFMQKSFANSVKLFFEVMTINPEHMSVLMTCLSVASRPADYLL